MLLRRRLCTMFGLMLALLVGFSAAESQQALLLLQTRATALDSTLDTLAVAPMADCLVQPVNQLPGLVPKQGMLLGGVLANYSDRIQYNKLSRLNLEVPTKHVWRMYKDLDKVDEWFYEHSKARMQSKLEKGQILWLDVMPDDWGTCATGGCDDYFLSMAKLLKSIKPAQAFVSIGHEIDHKWPDMVGTDEQFVQMVRRAKDVIVKAGGDNAVWKLIVSNQILDEGDSECWGNLMARWPGDEYVDWLGMNVYLKYANQTGKDTASYVYGETYRTSKMGHSIEDQLTLFTNKLTAASKPGHDFASKPWEISTIGVHRKVFDETFSDKLGNENLGVPDEFRLEFMHELKDVVNSDKFPQYKMVGYFDSGDCVVEDDHLVQSYYEFQSSPVFTVEHSC